MNLLGIDSDWEMAFCSRVCTFSMVYEMAFHEKRHCLQIIPASRTVRIPIPSHEMFWFLELDLGVSRHWEDRESRE
jgi:hypothetical protein